MLSNNSGNNVFNVVNGLGAILATTPKISSDQLMDSISSICSDIHIIKGRQLSIDLNKSTKKALFPGGPVTGWYFDSYLGGTT